MQIVPFFCFFFVKNFYWAFLFLLLFPWEIQMHSHPIIKEKNLWLSTLLWILPSYCVLYNLGQFLDMSDITNFIHLYVTVSNKNTHLVDFEPCAFREYLQKHLSYKKFFSSICIRAFRWKNNFSNPVTKSADIWKSAVLPEKK